MTAVSPVLRRSPVAALPQIHQIVLPTPWDVGPVQIYLVDSRPLTLIDTGVRSSASWAALETALDGLGVGFDEIERIVLTHYHGDHLGQAESIRRLAGDLEVWCHVDEASIIEGFSAERDVDIAGNGRLFREFGVPEDLIARQAASWRTWLAEDPLCEATAVDRVVRDGDRIEFKDFDLQVIHAPGHTAGHMLLYDEPSGTLVTGDHLMGDAVPFTENYYVDGAPDPADPLARTPRFQGLPEYLRSLRRLRGGSFRTILPAHGGVIERPSRTIDEALLFYEVRVQRLERALRKLGANGSAVTGWELWQTLFPKADPVREVRHRMLMVVGILDWLESEGRLRTLRRADGRLAHQPL